MPGEVAVLAVWGALLLALAVLLLGWTDDPLQLALLGGAGVFVLACALVTRLDGRARDVGAGGAAVAVGLGLGAVGAGLVAGQWLLLPGIAAVAVGLLLGLRS